MPPKATVPATFEWNKLKEVNPPAGNISESNENVRYTVKGEIMAHWDKAELERNAAIHTIMNIGTVGGRNARIDCQQDVNANNPYWNIQVQWGTGSLACLVLPAGLVNSKNRIKGLLTNLVEGIAIPGSASKKHTARFEYDPTL